MKTAKLERDQDKINSVIPKLIDKAFYWIRWSQNAEWEIAKWSESNKRFRLTNSMYQKIEDVYEIDTASITRK